MDRDNGGRIKIVISSASVGAVIAVLGALGFRSSKTADIDFMLEQALQDGELASIREQLRDQEIEQAKQEGAIDALQTIAAEHRAILERHEDRLDNLETRFNFRGIDK